MDQLKKQMWAKCVALILAVVTGLATAAFAALAMIVGIVPKLQGDKRAYEEAVYTPLLSSYAALLWDSMDFSEEDNAAGLDALDGGNIRYVVQRQSGSYFEDFTEEGYTSLYSNDPSLAADDALFTGTFESGDNVPRYNLSSFPWAMRGGHYLSYDPQGTWWISAEIEKVLYDQKEELFYFAGNGRYFLVPHFIVNHYEGTDSLILSQQYEVDRKSVV